MRASQGCTNITNLTNGQSFVASTDTIIRQWKLCHVQMNERKNSQQWSSRWMVAPGVSCPQTLFYDGGKTQKWENRETSMKTEYEMQEWCNDTEHFIEYYRIISSFALHFNVLIYSTWLDERLVKTFIHFFKVYYVFWSYIKLNPVCSKISDSTSIFCTGPFMQNSRL